MASVIKRHLGQIFQSSESQLICSTKAVITHSPGPVWFLKSRWHHAGPGWGRGVFLCVWGGCRGQCKVGDNKRGLQPPSPCLCCHGGLDKALRTWGDGASAVRGSCSQRGIFRELKVIIQNPVKGFGVGWWWGVLEEEGGS